MKFEVEITREHYYDYNIFVSDKLSQEINKNKIVIVLGSIILFLLFLYFFSLYREYEHICKSNFKYVAVNFVILLCLLTTYYFLSNLYSKLFIKYSVKDNGITLGKVEMEISETGIHERKTHSKFFHSWEIIQNLESSEICYYLVIENSRAIILPKDQINQGVLDMLNERV